MTRIERIQPSLHKKDRVLVYLTGGDLAALPERLKALRLPEWITLWQAHEPKPGARLI